MSGLICSAKLNQAMTKAQYHQRLLDIVDKHASKLTVKQIKQLIAKYE